MNAVVFIVLSRWLTLSEIGVVAAVQAPIIILQSLFTAMFPEFVIQERRQSQRRLSTIFWLSAISGALVSIGLALLAPMLTSGLNDAHAVTYMHVLSVCPFLWAIASVSEGLHRKVLNTKQLALRTLIATTIAATLALYAGYKGLGSWSIIIFTLVSTFLSCVLTVLTNTWRPSWSFSWLYLKRRADKFQSLIGRNVLAAATFPLIQYSVAIFLGTHDAGILQISIRIYSLVDSVVMTPYRFVLLPIFASMKRDGTEIAEKSLSAIGLGSFVSVPAYFGLLVIAPALVPLAVGPANGEPSVLIIQLLCLNAIIGSCGPIVNQILVARGYVSIVFRRQIAMYLCSILPSSLAAFFSLKAVALTYGAFGGSVNLLFTLLLARRYLGVPVQNALGVLARIILSASSLLLLLWVSSKISIDPLPQIGFIIVAAPLLYVSICALFQVQELRLALRAVTAKK